MGIRLWLLGGSAGCFISLGLSFLRCIGEDKSSIIHLFIYHNAFVSTFIHVLFSWCITLQHIYSVHAGHSARQGWDKKI